VSGWHLARWSHQQRDSLVVVDAAGTVVGSYQVPGDADRPCPQMLWETGWSEYPGAEWEEEPPGEWAVAVFNQGLIGGGG
jgi:hypothetical protein